MSKFTPNISIKRTQNKYRLVIMNDDTFEELIAFTLTRVSVYLTLCFVFIFLVGFTISLIVFTPLKYYIPGYGNADSRTELQLLKFKTDELEKNIHQKEQYITNLKKVIEGTEILVKDTTLLKDSTINDLK